MKNIWKDIWMSRSVCYWAPEILISLIDLINYYVHVMHIQCPTFLWLQDTNRTVAAAKQFI